MKMMVMVRGIVKKNGTALLAVLLLCLLTAGCGGQSGQARGGQPQEGQSQEGQPQEGQSQESQPQVGQEDPSREDKSRAEQTREDSRGPVRIGVLQIADSFPLYVAVSEGLFEKHGLDVEIIEFVEALPEIGSESGKGNLRGEFVTI